MSTFDFLPIYLHHGSRKVGQASSSKHPSRLVSRASGSTDFGFCSEIGQDQPRMEERNSSGDVVSITSEENSGAGRDPRKIARIGKIHDEVE